MKTFLYGLAFAAVSHATFANAEKLTGYIIENDADIARQQPGPHKGGGETTAFPFFAGASDMELVFRKRILHPGAAIGYHEQHKDEIYYVISGTGELTMNGEKSEVGPGTAILTRPGSSHGLRQVGSEDLVIFIVYGKDRKQ
ncbi:cupin domain-containing protein [Microbulbifer bruguierae]|uniref:Cupin domain-containing protein n=1 Tax=Microbulbifer bruguierae TaxID=3029061 RepID=A0ABY8NBC4_9GAMM|nr:cupin domain-containing protein [Microbulbifer bruguierae]WGL15882.1 cupin domain-containing protein [Microbulbifer bruguierae]